MREILFRGNRIDNGEWVEGFYFERKDTQGQIIEAIIIEDAYEQVTGGQRYIRSDLNHDCYRVDPDTVGQYTGLQDKNGKRIFEGDLLDGFEYPFFSHEEHNYFAEVLWFENCPAFGLCTHKHPMSSVSGISAGNCDLMEDFYGSQWEVIGNIHDNPELLEANHED